MQHGSAQQTRNALHLLVLHYQKYIYGLTILPPPGNIRGMCRFRIRKPNTKFCLFFLICTVVVTLWSVRSLRLQLLYAKKRLLPRNRLCFSKTQDQCTAYLTSRLRHCWKGKLVTQISIGGCTTKSKPGEHKRGYYRWLCLAY